MVAGAGEGTTTATGLAVPLFWSSACWYGGLMGVWAGGWYWYSGPSEYVRSLSKAERSPHARKGTSTRLMPSSSLKSVY